MIADADIKKLEKLFLTKKEFHVFVDNSVALFATKKETQEIRTDLHEIKSILNKILNTVDGITAHFERLEFEYVAFRHHEVRQDEKFDQLARYTGYRFE